MPNAGPIPVAKPYKPTGDGKYFGSKFNSHEVTHEMTFKSAVGNTTSPPKFNAEVARRNRSPRLRHFLHWKATLGKCNVDHHTNSIAFGGKGRCVDLFLVSSSSLMSVLENAIVGSVDATDRCLFADLFSKTICKISLPSFL